MGFFEDLFKGTKGDILGRTPSEPKLEEEEENFFTKLGRLAPAGLMGVAATPKKKEPSQEDINTAFEESPREDKQIGFLPPVIDRKIPKAAVVVTEELAQLYPEGSDVRNLYNQGYSVAMDQEGGILGAATKSGHLLSPKEALEQMPVAQLIEQSGYYPTTDNIDRFLKQNPDISKEPKDLSFFGLKPTRDEEIVKSPADIVWESAMQAPLFQVLTGLQTPLEIVGDGLTRYESLKTAVIENMPLNPFATVGDGYKAIEGTSETEFPDAALRHTKQKELGDIFRKLGMGESFSATGGLALDLLTDGVVLGLGGFATKNHLKGVKIGNKSGLEYVTERWHKFRSNTHVSSVEDALKGKRSVDLADAPEFIQQQRKMFGEKNMSIHDTTQAAREMDLFIGSEAKAGRDALPAITKGFNDPKVLSKLPADIQVVIRSAREGIDKASKGLAEEIRHVINNMPESAVEFQKSLGIEGGKKIPITQLPDIIAKNEGSYVRRAYRMFLDDFYKPTDDVTKAAMNGLMRDFPIASQEAESILKNILKTKQVHLPKRAGNIPSVTVNKGSFIERQNLPDYIRDYMGEITDPRYTSINTQQNISESLSKFRLFRLIDDLGLTSKTLNGTHSVAVKPGDSLAWGILKNKYITPEVDNMLTAVSAVENPISQAVINSMQFLKGMKTVFNPKTHAHNVTGNTFWFAGLADITPFNPKNWKFYKKAGQIMMDAKKVAAGKLPKTHPNYQIYRNSIEDTVLGTELPVSDQIKFVEELLKNPFGAQKKTGVWDTIKKTARGFAETYAMEDQVFKLTAYLKNLEKGMTRQAATTEMYKWFPNYAEAARLAQTARTHPIGLLFLNPFTTFRVEAHRIFLNSFKEGASQKLWTTAFLGGKGAANIAILSYMGLGMKEIKEYFMTRPEAVSEVMLNPLDPEGNLDVNTRYLDPFNTNGMWAPLMTYSGATGVNPIDYLLDFTNFSPEFGYSNLLVNAIEEFLTGRGKYGQELSAMEKVGAFAKGVSPTSVAVDLPKIVAKDTEGEERLRRSLRFFGIDVEKRDPFWIKTKVKSRLEERVKQGEDPSATVTAINTIGFDGDKMLQDVLKKQAKKATPPKKKKTPTDRAFDQSLAHFGF